LWLVAHIAQFALRMVAPVRQTATVTITIIHRTDWTETSVMILAGVSGNLKLLASLNNA